MYSTQNKAEKQGESKLQRLIEERLETMSTIRILSELSILSNRVGVGKETGENTWKNMGLRIRGVDHPERNEVVMAKTWVTEDAKAIDDEEVLKRQRSILEEVNMQVFKNGTASGEQGSMAKESKIVKSRGTNKKNKKEAVVAGERQVIGEVLGDRKEDEKSGVEQIERGVECMRIEAGAGVGSGIIGVGVRLGTGTGQKRRQKMKGFILPGISVETADNLLYKILNIDGAKIQERMLDFLQIEGVTIMLVRYITGVSKTEVGEVKKEGEGVQWWERRSKAIRMDAAERKRADTAVRLLTSGSACSQSLVEKNVVQIAYGIFEMLDSSARGSFEHFGQVMTHLLKINPQKVTQHLLSMGDGEQRAKPAGWISRLGFDLRLRSIAEGRPLVTEMFPFIGDRNVQQIFLKVVFGGWECGMGSVDFGLRPEPNFYRVGISHSKRLKHMISKHEMLRNNGFWDGVLMNLEDEQDEDAQRGAADLISVLVKSLCTKDGIEQLFEPISNSYYVVRRMAQLIVSKPDLEKYSGVVQILADLFGKTQLRYSKLVRLQQKINKIELTDNGGEQLLQAGVTGRAELETFVPGFCSQLTGLYGESDLTSFVPHSRRFSGERILLDDSYNNSDNGNNSEIENENENDNENGEDDEFEDYSRETQHLNASMIKNSDRITKKKSKKQSKSKGKLKNANQPTTNCCCETNGKYIESVDLMCSGSHSSSLSLSPSSTLSASSIMANDEDLLEHLPDLEDKAELDLPGTNDQQQDKSKESDSTSTKHSASKQKKTRLTQTRIRLLFVVVQILKETENFDEVIGWVDLRLWDQLAHWMLLHPKNSQLQSLAYQLISMVIHNCLYIHRQLLLKSSKLIKYFSSLSSSSSSSYADIDSSRCKNDDANSTASRVCVSCNPQYLFNSDSNPNSNPNSNANANANANSSSEASPPVPAFTTNCLGCNVRRKLACNCDKVLTYLIHSVELPKRLLEVLDKTFYKEAVGFYLLILNSFRLAIQADKYELWTNLRPSSNPVPVASSTGSVSRQKPKSKKRPVMHHKHTSKHTSISLQHRQLHKNHKTVLKGTSGDKANATARVSDEFDDSDEDSDSLNQLSSHNEQGEANANDDDDGYTDINNDKQKEHTAPSDKKHDTTGNKNINTNIFGNSSDISRFIFDDSCALFLEKSIATASTTSNNNLYSILSFLQRWQSSLLTNELWISSVEKLRTLTSEQTAIDKEFSLLSERLTSSPRQVPVKPKDTPVASDAIATTLKSPEKADAISHQQAGRDQRNYYKNLRPIPHYSPFRVDITQYRFHSHPNSHPNSHVHVHVHVPEHFYPQKSGKGAAEPPPGTALATAYSIVRNENDPRRNSFKRRVISRSIDQNHCFLVLPNTIASPSHNNPSIPKTSRDKVSAHPCYLSGIDFGSLYAFTLGFGLTYLLPSSPLAAPSFDNL